MALPVLPADGDDPWGAALRSALTDISSRADLGISNAAIAQAELDDVSDQVDTNTTTLSSYGTRITNVENSNATKASDSSVVKLTGNQTIAGTKTFGAAPIVPDNSFAISAVNGLQSQLNSKATLASPTFTGTVGGITAAMVGLANVDNTTDLNKPVSTAAQSALDLKANSTDLTSAIQTHNHTGGSNGVNLPIAAVSGLQTQINTFNTNINGKEPTVRWATASTSAFNINTSLFSMQYCWMVRSGHFAYINLLLTTKTSYSGGNVSNTLIGQINPASEFARVIDGGVNSSQPGIEFSLSNVATGTTATAALYGLDSNGQKGTVYLATLGAASFTLPSGYQFSLSGSFILDNSTG